jgi:hypothetical protein
VSPIARPELGQDIGDTALDGCFRDELGSPINWVGDKTGAWSSAEASGYSTILGPAPAEEHRAIFHT